MDFGTLSYATMTATHNDACYRKFQTEAQYVSVKRMGLIVHHLMEQRIHVLFLNFNTRLARLIWQNSHLNSPGILSMANAGPNTNGSQCKRMINAMIASIFPNFPMAMSSYTIYACSRFLLNQYKISFSLHRTHVVVGWEARRFWESYFRS
jgi:cyclophilin family peptidyl-prolyl cis-trans isomerase